MPESGLQPVSSGLPDLAQNYIALFWFQVKMFITKSGAYIPAPLLAFPKSLSTIAPSNLGEGPRCIVARTYSFSALSQAILEIAFAHIHSRFRTHNDLCSRLRSWRPERQQSFHRRPTALRCRPVSLASLRCTAAPPRVSRQSRHARWRFDHHLSRASDAGGQSSRSPSTTERTDCPRGSCAENPPPQSTYARLQGPAAHRKIATILLKEIARTDKRRLRPGH